MATLYNRAGHYIFALWFPSSSFFYLFPRLISEAADWMSIILPHMVWPEREFRMHLKCAACTRLAGNTGRKKIAILTPSRNFVGLYIYGTKSCIDNRKNLLNSNT